MANLQVKDLPDDLHEELRRRARFEGISIRDYVLRMIRHDQEYPSRAEWAEEMRNREPLPIGGDIAAQVRADREERSDHLAAIVRKRLRVAEGD